MWLYKSGTFKDPIILYDYQKTRSIIGFNYCEQLYKTEKDLGESYSKNDDYYSKRYEIRLEKSAPILDEFHEYVEREIKDALPRSPLGKALEYTKKLLPDMKTFLLDGSLEIDNNGAKTVIKPLYLVARTGYFQIHRKAQMQVPQYTA